MKQRILHYLPGDFPWQKHIYWFDTIQSTNTHGKTLLLQEHVPHGTVILAAAQSAGRGRLGRSFSSCEGGLYMSVILRFQHKPDELLHLTCAGAVAACDAVEKVTGLRPGIKWTNDLVLDGRKIAGILTELVLLPDQTGVVMGIGINCNQKTQDFPEEIRSFAGSLFAATGNDVDLAKLAAAWIEQMQSMDWCNREQIMERYRRDCVTVGKQVCVVRPDSVRHGQAIAVAEDGALVVRYENGDVEKVQSGEVSIRGMYGYI